MTNESYHTPTQPEDERDAELAFARSCMDLPEGWSFEPNTDVDERPMVLYWLRGPRGGYRIYDRWSNDCADLRAFVEAIVAYDRRV